MIPRTLVPVNVRPVREDEVNKPARRLTTYMDDRTVVPAEMSEDAPPLDGRTSIPAHLPLGVLVDRTLVPRGMPVKPLEKLAQAPALPLEILDSRVVVPAHVEPPTPGEMKNFERAPELTAELREVIEPDLFITGDANLLMEPEERRDPKEDVVTRVLSVLVHAGLIAFLIFLPKLFPAHVPTQDELELARKQLQWIYTPPEIPATPAPSPKVHITPKILKSVAPPIEQPQLPAPVSPEKPPTDLPDAPRPQSAAIQPPPQPAPSRIEPVEPPVAPNPNRLNLQLPQASPGRAIQSQIDDAIRRGASHGGISPGGPARPGVGGPGLNQGWQILSDTQGVNFDSYIQRLLTTLKRNWYAIMPESALMGDRGMVFTTFQINPDGSVPAPDPQLERTSGKEPLDNAAMSAIHASNPFEPLPKQFHGPYLKLRIVFLYNIPPEQVNLQ
ncbi:MAG: TonB C-terminal domain-containing protein [Acidobacteriia bacterium]|nr:TonB C-terminal domain-containing protein [Terriglobia bacterium]